MNKHTGSEKRKFPRLNTNFVISYRIKEQTDCYDLTQSKNVSQGGILLTTNRKFDKGIFLAITIRFPFVEQRIELIGEVVEAKEIVKGLIYDTRVRFLEGNTDIFKKLGEFIKQHLKNG
jgi:hypothetical protein